MNKLGPVLSLSFSVVSVQGQDVVQLETPADVSDLVISQDSRLMASSHRDGIRIWDIASSTEMVVISRPFVNTLEFSPDGATLASGSEKPWREDKGARIHLWDVESGDLLDSLSKDDGSIRDLAFSPDGSMLASVGYNAPLRVWDMTELEEVFPSEDWGGVHYSGRISFDPTGKILIKQGRVGGIYVTSAETGERISSFRGEDGADEITSYVVNPDGSTIVTINTRGIVRIREFPSGQIIGHLLGHYDFGQSVLSPNGSVAAVKAGYRELQLWDVVSGKILGSMKFEKFGELDIVAFSPDGTIMANGGAYEGGNIYLWDLSSQITDTEFVQPDENVLLAIPEDWHIHSSNVSWDLLDVRFVDGQTGWAVGLEGVLKTQDGGNTWRQVSSEGGSAVWFWDRDNGLMVQGRNLVKTQDGGTTWNIVYDNLPLRETYRGGNPRRVYFHSRSEGWIIANRHLFHTINGGLAWEEVKLELPEDYKGTDGECRERICERFNCCRWVHFRDFYFSGNWGWIVGGFTEQTGSTDWDDGAMIFETRDRGESWNRITASAWGAGGILGGVFGFESGSAWAGGSGEIIYRVEPENLSVQYTSTEDGWGGVWGYNRDFARNYVLNGMFFLDEKTGWVAGDRILHTTDGGRNWVEEAVFSEGLGPYLTRMDRAGNRLIVVGHQGQIWSRQIEKIPTAVEQTALYPIKSGLLQPYPNPFNNQIQIPYRLSEPGLVSLSVFNILGQQVNTLVKRTHPVGFFLTSWDAGDQASGVYFVQLTYPGGKQSQRLLLLR